MKHTLAFSLLSTTAAFAASQDACAPTPPVCHTQDNCSCTYCLGPAKAIANAPVRPYTCNGDWEIAIAGFYWKPHMDGLEYAVRDSVSDDFNLGNHTRSTVNLIDAKFESPNPKWDFGFKFGIGYNTTCDGWDFGVVWTSFKGHAHSHNEADFNESQSLITLWSAYISPFGTDTATDIDADWKVDLNLIDLSLGRHYWASPRFSMRPFMGLRIAFIDQDYNLSHKMGIFFDNLQISAQIPITSAFNNEVTMDLDFHGVGVRGGLDTSWHLGCGYSIFGSFSPSIVYGKFRLEHDEKNRAATSPFTKITVLSADDSFRASRAMLDLELGVSWFGLFCDCKYGVGVQLAWEQHLYYHFNQFWRVKRAAEIAAHVDDGSVSNDSGENTFHQRRGTLSTSGWTLQIQFDF